MNKFLFIVLVLTVAYSTTDCDVGQIRIDSQCTPLDFIDGCASYRFDGYCDLCQYGYDKDITGACMLNTQTSAKQCCAERGLDGFCQKCAPGLFLENNKCKRSIIYGCVVNNGRFCKACGKGFQLINDKCVKTIPGCESYNILGACTKCTSDTLKAENCQFKFQLFSGICLKSKVKAQQITNYVTKCTARNSYGCMQCENGFYLDQNRQCTVFQPGCITYFKGKCKQCSNYRGYYLDETKEKCFNKYQVNSINNCAQYDQLSQGFKCTGCKCGYRLCDGQCVQQKSLQIKIKKQCASGYYLASDYRCKVSSGNLVKQIQGNQNGVLIIKQPGCIFQNGKCQFCQAPFQKIDGKCTIPNCKELETKKSKNTQIFSCLSCRYPYELDGKGNCFVTFCSKYNGNKCVLCQVGYHLKAAQTCVRDDLNCFSYDTDGNCEQCADKYFISSTGQCMIKQSNCLAHQVSVSKVPVCTACIQGFFLNRNNQCQKLDPNCQFYVNGVCKTCKTRYFLHEYICFPYSIGCVKYNGKSCTQCKKGYTLFNGQCYSIKTLGMKLEGEDQNYNFDIYPIDITKSKYYIDNLSPVSQLGQFIFSSALSKDYINPALTFEDEYYSNEVQRSKGWKALTQQKGQYAGFRLNQGEDPVTFYALQLQFIQKTQIKSFNLEYTKDGINWIRVDNRFFVDQHINSNSPSYLKQNGIITIYFTGIYAQAIRIVIDEFVGWPACRLQFFYYDVLRFRKISNLKSLRYLREAIQSNYVDRLDNQLYINQKYFFSPQFQCHAGADLACFTGLQLCQARVIPSIDLINENKQSTGLASYVSQFYIAYSQNGRNFQCFKQCTKFQVTQKDLTVRGNYLSLHLQLGNLHAKNLRIYPTKWTGTPKLSIFYNYQ